MQERAQRKRGRISRNAMVVIIIQIQALSASPVLCNVCERERERERERRQQRGSGKRPSTTRPRGFEVEAVVESR